MASLIPMATRHAPVGMVCAIDHLAAEAGVEVMRGGGNAADAAIATSAVLAVTSQHLCGMGGDLFALVHTGGSAPPECINASGRAGAGADPVRMRAEGHRTMPLHGDIRSVPVPGCVDGWLALHERFGRAPLAAVLAPARRYAEGGFPASPTLAAAVPAIRDLAGAGDYRAPGAVRPGTLIRRPGVARALTAIVEHGRAGFYGGEFGDGLLAVGAGEFAPADLAAPLADWVEPLGLGAFGRTLWTVPPNSQGYLTLAAAAIADGLALPPPDDPGWAHLLVEAARQAGFDRPAVLHEHADGEALLAPDRLAARRAAIDPQRAARLGDRYGGGGTIYLCAVDGDRMGVSLIQSNASGWGAHIVEPATGIFLHSRGLGFSLVPGHPAEYEPGRRPPHTLSPALTTHPDGTLDMVIGSMGGDSQPQILLQLLARLLVAGQSPADALAAGRWVLRSLEASTGFNTWDAAGDVLVAIEGQAPTGWDDGLVARGHTVRRERPFDHGFGHAHVIVNHGDVLAGATDPRPRTGGCAAY